MVAVWGPILVSAYSLGPGNAPRDLEAGWKVHIQEQPMVRSPRGPGKPLGRGLS